MKYIILVMKENTKAIGTFDSKELAGEHLLKLANETEEDLMEPYESYEDVLVLNPDYEILPLNKI